MYIQIKPNDIIVANYLADLRLNYEYRRSGYDYQQMPESSLHINKFFNAELITTPSNIIIGILAELLVFSNLTKHLANKDSDMIQERFQYNLTIGAYDRGFDIIKNDKKIDIKCYGTKIIGDISEISRLNLLVDREQYEHTQSRADLYIQTFIVQKNEGIFLYIAGYATSNDLQLNTRFPKPAYCCSVNALHAYEELKQRYF